MTTPEARDARRPVRSCVGCRARRPVDLLVRLTSTGGGFRVDGASSGRGAWLCRADSDADGAVDKLASPACVDAALRRRAFDAVWRRRISPDEEGSIRALIGDHEH